MDMTEKETWDEYISKLREVEYPMLKEQTYLDHAGMTPPSRRLLERFAADQIAHLYGNPHSASPSSQLSTRRCEDVRHEVLKFFNADPMYFDVIFVANATAGIKLVTDSLRDNSAGFCYGYHFDSHTSLVGAREAASGGHTCFASNDEFEKAIASSDQLDCNRQGCVQLLAFPAQSNLNGRRLPLSWCRAIRQSSGRTGIPKLSLLDAASFVSTAPLDLSDYDSAPDFTVLSLYKIFGFPDLGALIVRNDSGEVLRQKRYFGGGTVDVATCFQEQWHVKKTSSIHEAVEDGTLPVHSIAALGLAMETHKEMFLSMEQISKHTSQLADRLYNELTSLRHGNGRSLCKFYLATDRPRFGNKGMQGPILAFTLTNSQGAWISNTEVEKLASIRNIHLRTGGLCNPGGIASHLELAAWELKSNFSAGYRCGAEDDHTSGGKPNGMIRVSLGATSNTQDVQTFVDFIREFFVETVSSIACIPSLPDWNAVTENFFIESLTVFPIKSCAGWRVPAGLKWEVRREGLAWDREWCLVHKGTGKALSQKRNPKMALLRPELNLVEGHLTVRFDDNSVSDAVREISIPLSHNPRVYQTSSASEQLRLSSVCGDTIQTRVYTSAAISEFFSEALGVPCQLVRYPNQGSSLSRRQYKASFASPNQLLPAEVSFEREPSRPLLLANESPILIISRSSVNRLNEQIKEGGGSAINADSFRANIVIAQDLNIKPGTEQPYAEEGWSMLRIGNQFFQLLGPCRRCQMVCIDQRTAEKREEPLVTLAKTRRFDSKIFFGQHACHVPLADDMASLQATWPSIALGDRVQPLQDDESKVVLERAAT